MDFKNMLEVNTAEIVENILQIKLKNMANTYFAYSIRFKKSYIVIIDKDGNIIDTQVVLLDPDEEKYIKDIIDSL